MLVQDIIMKKPYLAWYVSDPKKLSDEATLEHILNYGDWEDFKQFLAIKGIQESADIFLHTLEKARSNYSPKTKNYFKLYFNKYAQRSPK